VQPGLLSTADVTMTHTISDRAVKTLAAFALLGALGACSDARTPSAVTPLEPTTTHPVTPVAHLRGTLDVATGTLTFDPVSPSGASLASGPSTAIYGNQGLNVQIYNSAVVTSAPVAGKKTYTANVGVRNKLAFRIGDEQNAGAPPDTMGIYVFVNTQPVVSGTSSPCSCTVTVKNADGVLNFSGTNQPYWFWSDIVGAAISVRDTTARRKTWVFEADTQVTRFNFDVLVSAAWVAPRDSVWTVTYSGDSLPDTSATPHWHRAATSKFTVAKLGGGLLDVEVQRSKDSVLFVRNDSISAASSGYIEGRFRLDNGGNDPSPQAGIAFDDNNKRMALLVSDSALGSLAQVGFANASGAFITGATFPVSVKSLHVYTLRKFGTDSVVGYVDGISRVRVAYTVLPPSQYPAGQPSLFEFGIVATSARNTITTWDYVIYQIGKATP
jgi:hypothetical protein